MTDIPRGPSQAEIAGWGLAQGKLVGGVSRQPQGFLPTANAREADKGRGMDVPASRFQRLTDRPTPLIITTAAATPGPQGAEKPPEQAGGRVAEEHTSAFPPAADPGEPGQRRGRVTAPGPDPDRPPVGRDMSIREPRRRRPVSPFQQQTISRTPGEDVAVEAFTAKPFKRRVNAGRLREETLGAESAFIVAATEGTIIYSAMQQGGAHPTFYPEMATAGMQEQTDLGIKSFFGPLLEDKAARSEIDDAEGIMKLDDHSFVGAFHFHAPMNNYGGFSDPDITIYERLDPYVNEELSLGLNTHQMWFGVFLSRRERNRPMDTKLFMFQGPAQNTIYQARDFTNLSWQTQQRVLEDSGMRTIVVDIPFERGAADLSPLAVALRLQNIEDEPSQPGYRTRPEDREVPPGYTHVIEAGENPDEVKDRDRIDREILRLRGHKNHAAPESTGRSTGPLPASGGPRPEGDREN